MSIVFSKFVPATEGPISWIWIMILDDPSVKASSKTNVLNQSALPAPMQAQGSLRGREKDAANDLYIK